MEGRQEFISRMFWLVREVDSSKFSSLDSLPMLEFELKMRDEKILKFVKDLVINSIDVSALGTDKTLYYKRVAREISSKTELKFEEIIRNVV